MAVRTARDLPRKLVITVQYGCNRPGRGQALATRQKKKEKKMWEGTRFSLFSFTDTRLQLSFDSRFKFELNST